MSEDKLKIVRDVSNKDHFNTKDDQLVNIEHKDEKIVLNLFKWGEETSLQINLDMVLTPNHLYIG